MVWQRSISIKALEKAKSTSVKIGDTIVFITKIEGRLYAMNGVCTHAKCILGHLNADALKVKCYCHDAQFDLTSGRMTDPPYVAPNAPMEKLGLSTYEIRDNNGFVEVNL